MYKLAISVVALSIAMCGCSRFEDPTMDVVYDSDGAPAPSRREPVPHNATRNLLWGDLHIHTALSFDAFTMGVRAMPDDAYRFLQGGTIQHGLGYPIRASRPLDFGAVTDHAEYLGIPRHLAGEEKDTLDQA